MNSLAVDSIRLDEFWLPLQGMFGALCRYCGIQERAFYQVATVVESYIM
jgi:hypothetical protein